MKTITTKQYMDLQLMVRTFKDETKLNKEVIKYFHGNLEISFKDSEQLIQDVYKILADKPDFVQRFIYDGVEYGFLPNLSSDQLSTAEFIDLDDYLKDGEQLNKIAAILYRPITHSLGELYTIEKYEGTDKYKDIMNGVDYKIIAGAIVFFWNLSNSLLNASNTYIHKKK